MEAQRLLDDQQRRYRRQKDELQVLQSIFEDDVIQHKIANCWSQPCPLEVKIRLKPDGREVYASLELDVLCSASYPDVPPSLALRNVVGLAREQTNALETALAAKAKELAGAVMLYDLCQLVIEFLNMHNRKPLGSMHEAMLKGQEHRDEEQKRLREELETRELAEIAEENKRRDELNQKMEEPNEPNRLLAEMMSSGQLSSNYELVEMLGEKTGQQKRIYKALKLPAPRSPPASTSTFASSGEGGASEWWGWDQHRWLIITEWTFKHTLGRRQGREKAEISPLAAASFEKCLDTAAQSIVGTLTPLKRTIDQQQRLLVPLAFLKRKKQAVAPTNFNCQILIGQYVDTDGERCLSHGETRTRVKEDFRRLGPLLAAQLVGALRCLHLNGIAHGHLSARCVWFSAEKRSFRLSDYHSGAIMHQLEKEFSLMVHDEGDAKEIPNAMEPLSVRQQRDLFCLGTLIDSFLEKETGELSTIGHETADDETVKQAKSFVMALQQAKGVDDVADHKYLLMQRWPYDSASQPTALLDAGLAGDSRLVKEFQIVEWLGRGGFGDVWLARNRLDDNDYAIKRIPLNPKNEALNQKIKREAKLFARLNHEHVVRYYAAWIEAGHHTRNQQQSTTNLSPTSPQKARAEESVLAGVKRLESIPELFSSASPAQAGSPSSTSTSSSSSGDGQLGRFWRKPRPSQRTNAQLMGVQGSIHTLFSPHSKSLTAGHSEFDASTLDEEDDGEDEEEEGPGVHAPKEGGEPAGATAMTQILYIQMEYCSNYTLRALIDTGRLRTDVPMIWRIFRELLSGLQYIHHQNLIHRDIKPMNILLDWSMSVKIGDFGLATRDLLTMHQEAGDRIPAGGDERKTSGSREREGRLPSGAMTKDIGTHLYLAPEVRKSSGAGSKRYSAKIDIYSSGIVLFEMVWKPASTVAERLTTIQTLRTTHPPVFPEDFGHEIAPRHALAAKKLVEWMMREESEERPTVDALIRSDMIPMVDIEENEFQKLFLQTLNKRKGRLYKWMVEEMICCKVPPAADYCFDQGICMRENDKDALEQAQLVDGLRKEMEAIFRLHAFTSVRTHSFIPSRLAATTEKQNSSSGELQTSIANLRQCTVIDASGISFELPHNIPTTQNSLRDSFIRYCARNAVTRMKRYTFGTVYSQADVVGGVHPSERTECCLDVLGSASAKEAYAAEVLTTIIALARGLSTLNKLKCILVVGHSLFLEMACLHLGISDAKVRKNIAETFYHFATLNKKPTPDGKCEQLASRCELSYQLVNALLRLLEPATSLEALADQVRPMSRSKLLDVKEKSKQALAETSKALHALKVSGILGDLDPSMISIVYDPALAYRPQTFHGGLLYLLRVEMLHTRKSNELFTGGNKRNKSLVILAGGAYEEVINAERRAQDPLPAAPICAFGVNIPMENLAHLHQLRSRAAEDGAVLFAGPSGVPATCIALVCTASTELLVEGYELMNQLRSLRISTDLIHEPAQAAYQIFEQQHLLSSSQFLLEVVKKDEVEVSTRGQTLDPASGVTQRRAHITLPQSRVTLEEAIKVVRQSLLAAPSTEPIHPNFSNAAASAGTQPYDTFGLAASGPSGGPQESATTEGPKGDSKEGKATYTNLNISYALAEERGQKPAQNTRRKIETQVRNSLADLSAWLKPNKCRVDVIVTDLSAEMLRLLSSLLDRQMGPVELKRAIDTAHKQAGRQKGDVALLLPLLQDLIAQPTGSVSTNQSVVVLWTRASGSEGFYRAII